jgi:hypothetical protein
VRPDVYLGDNQEFRDLFDVTGSVVATARVTLKDGNVVAADLYNMYGEQYYLAMAGEGNGLSLTATAVTEYRLTDKRSVKSSLFHNQKFYADCVYTDGYLTTYIHYDSHTAETYRYTCTEEECLTVSPPTADRVTVSVYSKAEGNFLRSEELDLYNGTVLN